MRFISPVSKTCLGVLGLAMMTSLLGFAPPSATVEPSAAAQRTILDFGIAVPGTGFDRSTGLPREITHRRSGMRMVLVLPGSFVMGAAPNDRWADPGERRMRLTITTPFYLGKFEVTQSQWAAVMGGDNPSLYKGANVPIAGMSIAEVQMYLDRTGLRVPSEGEWEYAARAGTTGPWYGNPAAIAVTRETNEMPHPWPVGSKAPNPWGFHDMLGNVWELTGTAYPGRQAVSMRGGSFEYPISHARASQRGPFALDGRSWDVGFRVALTPGV